MDYKTILSNIGLTDEQITNIEKAINKEIPKEFVSKEQYNKKVVALSEVNAELTQVKGELTDSQATNSNNAKYKSDYESLLTEYNNYKRDIEGKQVKESKLKAIEEMLKKDNFVPSSIRLLQKEFDIDKIELDENNKVKDWENLSKGVKEEFKDFIQVQKKDGFTPQTPPQGGKVDTCNTLEGALMELYTK